MRDQRDEPSFPREAIRAGVEKGQVVARLTIDEKGNVTDVDIVGASRRASSTASSATR